MSDAREGSEPDEGPRWLRSRRRFSYSRWDGTQAWEDAGAQSVLDALADDYLRHGDLARALRRLALQGYTDPDGTRRLGLQDLLTRLRRERDRQLQRFDLDRLLDDVKARLAHVQTLEREGLDRLAGPPGAPPDPRAEAGRRFLDDLPPDPGGQVAALSRYDFVDDRAREAFRELLGALQRQVVQQQFQGLKEGLQGLTPADLRRLGEMAAALNQMLRARAAGEEPDFADFQARFGQDFPGVTSLDQLLERLARGQLALRGLLDSLNPQQRMALAGLVDAVVGDPALRRELAELARHLADALPEEARTRFPFRGAAAPGLQEALETMERLQGLDALERAIGEARRSGDLDQVDPGQVAELLGGDAAEALREAQSLARRLEEAGLVRREQGRLRLTARAVRRIGQKALEDIFADLDRDAFGQHRLPERGVGGERAEDTKPYTFGDPFHLHLERTLMRAVGRRGAGTPLRLEPEDFEVYRTEHLTQAATVVMLDMSLSMLNNDLWLPAKKVTIALESLIRSRFPRDRLYVVGFSHLAQVYAPADLMTLTEWDTLRGTNMVHGLRLARQLLARSRAQNRQVIMVTDGGPTVWEQDGHWSFDWPTNLPTERQTLREVRRCAREGIAINVFMLADDADLRRFVARMAAVNRGRALYADPDRLGEYVLVDYLRQKQKRVQ